VVPSNKGGRLLGQVVPSKIGSRLCSAAGAAGSIEQRKWHWRSNSLSELSLFKMDGTTTLQAGDCVLLNGATSTVGQALLQLCKLLKLRAVAVARPPSVVEERTDDGVPAQMR
jgi:trans-2-enoyl-CoA reductase